MKPQHQPQGNSELNTKSRQLSGHDNQAFSPENQNQTADKPREQKVKNVTRRSERRILYGFDNYGFSREQQQIDISNLTSLPPEPSYPDDRY